MSEQPPNHSRKIYWLLTALAAGWISVLLVTAALDRYLFVMKTMIVPILFLVAVIARRGKVFVRDWAVFLAFVTLFDSLRGLIWAAITQFDLPVYMDYVIQLEKALTGFPVLTKPLQERLFDPPIVGPFEKFFVAIYGTHFLFFLLFALFVWFLRHESFWRFKAGLMAVLSIGIVGYALVPTVPPWMASNEFLMIPPIHMIRTEMRQVGVSWIEIAMDVNPVAAMPSLHIAIPSFCTLAALHLFRLRAIPLIPYLLSVLFAVVYLGEHYLVDAVAGFALAAVCYVLSFRSTWFERKVMSRQVDESSLMRRNLTAMGLMIVTALAVGHISFQLMTKWTINQSFVERELAGRSVLENYYRGWIAYADNDFPVAQASLSRALDELPSAQKRKRKQVLMQFSESAFRNEDYQSIIQQLEHSEADRSHWFTGCYLAMAYIRTGDPHRGIELLQKIVDKHPSSVEPRYWQARALHELRLVSPAQIEKVARLISKMKNRDKALFYSEKLMQVLEKYKEAGS